MKHDQDLGAGFTAKLDVDYVSDADYLLEFKDGFTGFTKANETFESMFGRSLNEYDDTTRENSLLINKVWTGYNLNIKTLWHDNVKARQDETDTTLQTLPSIEFDASRQQIGTSGFYYTLDSEFRSFYRQDTDIDTGTRNFTDAGDYRKSQLVNGQRADIHPKFYYPTHLGKAFYLEPYVGLHGTAWQTDGFTDYSGDDSDFRTRGMYEVGAELSTSLNRIFTLNNDFATQIKHEIAPKLEYHFIPYENQKNLPYFDSVDDIDEVNAVTWSLTHTFTGKSQTTRQDGTTSGPTKLAWFKLYQIYSIKDERDDKDAQGRPWQALRLKYELYPFEYLTSNGDIAFDPYTQHFTEVKVGATLKDNRGDSLYTSFRYSSDDPYLTGDTDDVYTHTWLTRLNAQILDSLSAYYSVEMDLEDETTVETIVGFKVDKECWGFRFEFQDTSADKSFAFMVTLKGIGEFGSQ